MVQSMNRSSIIDIQDWPKESLPRGHEALQLLEPVLNDDELRGWERFSGRPCVFDHQEAPAIEGHVVLGTTLRR